MPTRHSPKRTYSLVSNIGDIWSLEEGWDESSIVLDIGEVGLDAVLQHPEFTEQTVWQVFEAERPKLVPYAGRFDGFHAVPASVSKTCLVRFDNNKYSVAASAVGRPVEVHAYADRIVIRQDGRIVAEHPRSFGRGDTVLRPLALRTCSRS